MKKLPFLLAVPLLALNGFFVAKMEVYPELARVGKRPELAVVSALFVVVFALPSFLALTRWLGWRRGGAALLALGVFAVGIETIAIQTGYPYGRFSYGDKIGGKVFGVVPWTVPFAWTPLLLAAFALARFALAAFAPPRFVPERLAPERRASDARLVIALSALLITLLDGVLDPGAVAQGFWTYQDPGAYYGVPLSNFAGWLLSGALGTWLLWRMLGRHRNEAPPTALLGSAFLILVFWTSVCLWSALWIPTALGLFWLAFIGPVFLRGEERHVR